MPNQWSQYDYGNPFAAQRQMLMPQLFRQAMSFGQTGVGGMMSRGGFDPNLAEAMRNSAFGEAINAGSMGLANLAGQEGQWFEGKRQFNIQADLQQQQMDLQRAMFEAEKKAGKTNILDWVGAIGGLLPGVGGIMNAVGMFGQNKNMSSMLSQMFGGGGGGGGSVGGFGGMGGGFANMNSNWGMESMPNLQSIMQGLMSGGSGNGSIGGFGGIGSNIGGGFANWNMQNMPNLQDLLQWMQSQQRQGQGGGGYNGVRSRSTYDTPHGG